MEIDHVLIRVADLDAASHALDAEHGLSTVGSYRSTIVHARGCSEASLSRARSAGSQSEDCPARAVQRTNTLRPEARLLGCGAAHRQDGYSGRSSLNLSPALAKPPTLERQLHGDHAGAELLVLRHPSHLNHFTGLVQGRDSLAAPACGHYFILGSFAAQHES
jgi:hypothetical protein